MVSLIYLIFAIATGTLAEFDPTITAAPNTPAAVYSTPPLSPLDPNYVHQDPLASIGENITDTTLEKRSPPVGIYVCDLPDWKGTCAWHAVKDSSCTEFPWKAGISIGVSWPGVPNSSRFCLLITSSLMQPSMGLQCKVYYNKDCAGGERTDGSLTYPGAPNFGVLYSFTKQPAAYRCRTCPNGQTW